MDQVRSCGSSSYQTNDLGDHPTNIVVQAKADPATIAGALADALMRKSEVMVGQQAVVAWPPTDTLPIIEIPPGSLGGPLLSLDSGYVAEFQEGRLHFDVCTSWTEHPAGGTICDDRLEFEVEVDAATP